MRHSVNTANALIPLQLNLLDLQHSYDPRHISSLPAPHPIDDQLFSLVPFHGVGIGVAFRTVRIIGLSLLDLHETHGVFGVQSTFWFTRVVLGSTIYPLP
jgi:hypothetical protein